jgi:hypothetical protein
MAALKQLYTLLNAILLAVQLTVCQRAARSSLLHFRLQAEAYSRISPSYRLPALGHSLGFRTVGVRVSVSVTSGELTDEKKCLVLTKAVRGQGRHV